MIDIGSNSVRLVVYEGLSRSPTPLFNEKILCGLGREVQTTGLLAPEAISKALAALRRFRALCKVMGVSRVWTIATAACRDARNGPDFIARAKKICGRIDILSGSREAELSAYGVMAGFVAPNGVAGDLGGGSLELIDIRGKRIKNAVTRPLGGLALQDLSAKSVKRAERLVRKGLADANMLTRGKGRVFYAIGGSWRALARLHIWQTGYPLHVMHGYAMSPQEAIEFSQLIQRVDAETLAQIEVVADARRPLLAYAALVLEQVVRRMKPRAIVFSALGVREGLLYSKLAAKERKLDPLISAARGLNILRSRSPLHGEELIAWTDRLFATAHLPESQDEKRMRHAACLLADIGWRAHPDYRGEQSLDIIANASFVGIDHPGRAYLALAVYFRHVGLVDEELSPRLRELASTRLLDHARILGAAMRVAYMISASQPHVLPETPIAVKGRKVVLTLNRKYAPLAGERVYTRLRQLARVLGREPLIVTL